MIAKRKSDGKQIEVREWRGASDVVYSTLDMNEFYQESEIDFNIDAEDTVISGWVARDGSGSLNVFDEEPIRDEELEMWSDGSDHFGLPYSSFPDLTWESEPKKVRLIIEEIEE